MNSEPGGPADAATLLQDLKENLRYGPNGQVRRSVYIKQIHDEGAMVPCLRVYDRASEMSTKVLLRGLDVYVTYDKPFEFFTTLNPRSDTPLAEQAAAAVAGLLAPLAVVQA